MPETQFVPGWAVAALLVVLVLAVLGWVLYKSTEEDPWWLEKYGPHTDETYDWEHDEVHPGYCDQHHVIDGMTLTCDLAPNHKTDHFDSFAKQSWRRLGWK